MLPLSFVAASTPPGHAHGALALVRRPMGPARAARGIAAIAVNKALKEYRSNSLEWERRNDAARRHDPREFT